MFTTHSASLRYEPGKENWEACLEEGLRTQPPCQVYAKELLLYTQALSGGRSGSLLKELKEFKIGFAQSAGRYVGGAFLERVAKQKFQKLQPNPYIRTAEVKLQLSSPDHRVENGLCKFVTVADVTRLSDTKLALKVSTAEDIMRKSRDVVNGMSDVLDQADRVMIIGKLDTRLVAHLMGKGKHTTEGFEFPNLETIAQIFIDELTKASGTEVKSPFAKASKGSKVVDHSEDKSASSSAVDSKQAMARPESVEEMSSPIFQAGKLGFKVDNIVVMKDASIDGCPYRIVSMAEDKGNNVVLKKIELGEVVGKALKVPLEKLISDYKVYRAALRSVLTPPPNSDPLNHPSLAIDISKGKVVAALCGLYSKYQDSHKIRFLKNPNGVQATKQISIRGLHLVPITCNIRAINTSEDNTGVVQTSIVEPLGGAFRLMYCLNVKEDGAGKDKRPPFLAPFWLVEASSESKNVNLELIWETHQSGVCIPILSPNRKIDKGECLIRTDVVCAR